MRAESQVGVATIRVALAPMHAEGRVSSPQISQQLGGHAVTVLEEVGDWAHVRGSDDYEGWIHRGFLTAVAGPAPQRSRGRLRLSLGCVARDEAGARRALPFRAFLRPEESVTVGEAVDLVEATTRFPPDAVAITNSAREYFEGTTYQWGGVTPWGADCSGMVQSVFALHGVPLPRDARQQVESGRDAAPDLLDAQPADLLFFSDRTDRAITHVGIALGEGGMVHLGLGRGGYAVERLDDQRDPYVAALVGRFVGARKVL